MCDISVRICVFVWLKKELSLHLHTHTQHTCTHTHTHTQVTIMRFKKEVEDLKEELKREQEGKLQMDAAAAGIAAPALTPGLM